MEIQSINSNINIREAAEEQKQIREYYYKKELSIESLYSSFAGVNLRVQ